MIRNFRDHAANERTLLASVRTAIAVMAFGFLIERFNLLLKTTGLLSDAATPHRSDYDVATIAGVSSIVVGTIMFALNRPFPSHRRQDR